MRRSQYLSKLADTGYQKGALKLLAAGLLLSNVLLLIMLMSATGQAQKTIVVPPDFKRSFWVSGDTASPEYLEQMGMYYATLMLNYSPENIQYQTSQFLKFASPTVFGELSGKFTDDVGKVVRNQLSSVFYPQSVDIRGLAVTFVGIQTVFVGKNITEQKQRKYRIDMEMGAQQPLVIAFQEIPIVDGKPPAVATPTAPQPQ